MGPYSLGAPHQRSPLRLKKTIPFNTGWSSTHGLPWLLGRYGASRAICSSVSQYRSLFPGLLTEPESYQARRITDL